MTESISFPQAIASTQSLMAKISQNELKEAEIENAIADLVSSKNGARGFFVAYLTGDSPLADSPSIGVINALKSSADLVAELLVKNLAMSSAMAIAHARNVDLDSKKGSQRVSSRTANLIQKLNSELISQHLDRLKIAIGKGEGDYENFLQRWGYDAEQKQAIAQAISQL